MRYEIDFHAVKPAHEAVHAELQNWAAWCEPRRRGGLGCAPMFRLYRPPPEFSGHEPTRQVDALAAVSAQQKFIGLPEKHRHALAWAYVYPWVPPGKAQRLLALTRQGLADLVHDGRQMLANRT